MEKVPVYKNVELIKEDFKAASLPKIRDDFIAKLENALMFMSYKDLNMWHTDAADNVNLKSYDGAWLIDVNLKHKEDEKFAFAPFSDLQVTPDMFPHMNIKLMNLSSEIGNLTKHKFLTMKEKRHLPRYKHILSEQISLLDYGKQKWWSTSFGYGINKMVESEVKEEILKYANLVPISLKPGYYIKPAHATTWVKEQLTDVESPFATTLKMFHMALQLSLTYYYEWSCYIKETPDSLGVRIPIHPSSSKEVFIMRNIPEGKTRKRAIVNFVKEHYRTITDFNDRERQILINKHFRGDLKFNWRGLEVHITPSMYDIQRIKTTKKFINFETI